MHVKKPQSTSTPTPIHLLPHEILYHIFVKAGLSIVCPAAADTSQLHPLFNLPLICKRWHQVIAKAHALWSHIDVELGGNTKRNRIRLRNITQRWLNLAQGGAVPLHLHFLGGSELAQCNLPQTLSVLRPHVERIKTLTFSKDFDEVLVQSILGLCMSGSVSSLTLNGIRAHAHADNHLIWSANRFPNLVCLELAGLSEETEPALSEVIEILRSSPGLKTLKLQHMAIKIDQDLASESVILSELRCLDLTGLADSSLSCLLGILSPGSHQLDVRLKPSGKRQNQRTVQAFLRRVDVGHLYLSYPQTWDSNHDPSISLRPYLSRTPNLRVLVLDLTSDEDLSKIDVLATVHSAQTCPLLTTLCIIGHHFSETGVDQLKQIVEAQSSLRQLVFVNSEIKVYLDTVEEEEMYKERVNAWLAERVREVLWKQVPCFDEDRVAEHVERVLARK